MPRELDTRGRMLRTAARLLQRQGFHATGLKQILDESGTPRGSLYFHFPGGKEHLAVEALRQEGARVAHAVERTLATHADPIDALQAFIENFAALLRRSAFTEGCPVATVTLEAAAGSAAIRAACDASYGEWHRLLQARLVDAGIAAATAASLATVVLAAVEGALVLSRARHDVEPFRAVARHLADLLRAALPIPARRPRPPRGAKGGVSRRRPAARRHGHAR